MMVMTASAKEIVKFMGLREKPVLIATNPVQSHIKLSVVRRPSNAFGLAGKEGVDGVLKPGLWSILNEIYFREFFRDRAEGREPKHAIIFCRGMRIMSKLHSHLSTVSGFCDARDSPFVMFHADITPATEQVILDRIDDYQALLSTTRGLLGYNFKKIDVVIFLQPYDESAFVLQGGGRGGRRQLDGLKRCVQVYQLWNPEDLTKRNKLMTEEMRRICRTGATACTRDLLQQSFHIWKGKPVRMPEEERGQICCHYHDLLAMRQIE
jgi:superfamily II DNA/RNA helicase